MLKLINDEIDLLMRSEIEIVGCWNFCKLLFDVLMKVQREGRREIKVRGEKIRGTSNDA